jgi:small subunit ribosomal protein S6
MPKAASTEAADDIKKYELMVIINPDIGENAAKTRLNEIKKLITSEDGEIFFEDVWGLRDMAYPIKRHRQGYYVVLDFIVDPQKLKEMDHTLRIDPEVVRHMITVLPLAYQPKSFAVIEEEVVVKPEKKVEKPRYESRPPRKEKMEEAPVKKVEAEEAPAKEAKAPAKEEKNTSLEDVDAKLRSIIDNPDINF